ncbi:hypothetical protein ZWY2020_009275 [Hordeum vulgare]|nr:hypothetical protein ZWY2020_009275 [Hordeum vulgare]
MRNAGGARALLPLFRPSSAVILQPEEGPAAAVAPEQHRHLPIGAGDDLIHAEEDQDPVRENRMQKEVDACAMMMDTTMFDATNPMMEWLNENDEHVILDGVDAASAMFEQIRLLNSSKKVSHLGRMDNGRKRKRVEEEEDDYNDSEDDDEENEELEIDDDDDSHDDGASQSDGADPAIQLEKDLPSQVGNNDEVSSDGSLVNRRSERVRQAKKVKEVTSLYN